MRKFFSIVTLLLIGLSYTSLAQSVPVTISTKTQVMNGRTYYVHIIQKGQTVYSIARAYGLKYVDAVTHKDIHDLNTGDTVWLPCKGQVPQVEEVKMEQPVAPQSKKRTKTITVQQGQTLYSISKMYQTTVDELLEQNPEVKLEGLKAGQTLVVPDKDAIMPETSKPTNNSQQSTPKDNKPVSESSKVPQVKASSPENSSLVVRDRVSKEKIHISLMMPLYLDKMGEISTTKFDVDQRGKKDYKCFEFIQFYEGVLLGLEELESQGFQIVLNVIDVPSEDESAVEQAYNSHNAANSDYIIALLTKRPFEKVSALAKRDKVFVISPLSTREEILKGNPYTVKYMPSAEGVVKSMLNVVARQNAHVYIIHSNSKLETPYFSQFQSQLNGRSDIKYTFFDWSMNAKLASSLKQTSNNVVISIYDQGKDKNRIFTNQLLNRLLAIKTNIPMLMTPTNFLKEYTDMDFSQLQHVNYAMVNPAYLDYENPVHKSFIESFKNKYKTEPIGQYAGVGHDIIIYFSTGLWQKNADFWKKPSIPQPKGMLYPIQLRSTGPEDGYENQIASIYCMEDYKLVQLNNLTH